MVWWHPCAPLDKEGGGGPAPCRLGTADGGGGPVCAARGESSSGKEHKMFLASGVLRQERGLGAIITETCKWEK